MFLGLLDPAPDPLVRGMDPDPVREGAEEPSEEANDSLETDPLLFRGSSRRSRRRNGARRQ